MIRYIKTYYRKPHYEPALSTSIQHRISAKDRATQIPLKVDNELLIERALDIASTHNKHVALMCIGFQSKKFVTQYTYTILRNQVYSNLAEISLVLATPDGDTALICTSVPSSGICISDALHSLTYSIEFYATPDYAEVSTSVDQNTYRESLLAYRRSVRGVGFLTGTVFCKHRYNRSEFCRFKMIETIRCILFNDKMSIDMSNHDIARRENLIRKFTPENPDDIFLGRAKMSYSGEMSEIEQTA